MRVASRSMGDDTQQLHSETQEVTELAGVAEAETGSVFAWGLCDELEQQPARRFITSGRITAAAVAVSVALMVGAGLLAYHGWQHPALVPQAVPTSAARTPVSIAVAAPSTVVPVPSATAVAAPAPATPASPVTVTMQAAPSTTARRQRTDDVPPDLVAAYDRQFLAGLQSDGWSITDPAAMTKNAHIVCAMFEKGQPPEYVNQQVAQGMAVSETAAVLFTSEAMIVYPGCREPAP